MEIKYTKYFCYYLGYLYSDGYIQKGRRRGSIKLEISEEDALEIKNDLEKISFLNFNFRTRQRKGKKKITLIECNNTKFYDEYLSKYFLNKSIKAPIDLINDIPNELKLYFYRGLIDGDGCFFHTKNLKVRYFSITSSYDQDWAHIELLFKKINLSQYRIIKHKNNKGKSSSIIISKYNEIVKLYNFIYPKGICEIGLKRKFEKCKFIIDNPVKYNSNRSEINETDFSNNFNKGLSLEKLMNIYDCSSKKILNMCKKLNIMYNSEFIYKKSLLDNNRRKLSKI